MNAYSTVAAATAMPSEPLDEHVDDFCFSLALALRRLLGLTVDTPAAESEAEEEFENLLEDIRHE